MITKKEFLKRIRKTRSCWIWLGAKDKNTGYGKAAGDGNSTCAHRMAYKLFRGPIGRLHVLHKCDVKLCVNPKHLFLGTAQDNIDDMFAKKRNPDWGKLPKRKVHIGSDNYIAKLKEAHIPKIVKLRLKGLTYEQIAVKFGVSGAAIRQIIIGRSWKHVTGGALSIS
jgi:hypothetical protein